MLSLLSCINVPIVRDMRLYTADEDDAWWRTQREAHAFADQPYAVLAPTARWESKRWPADRFAALIPHILKRGLERIVITGGPGEADQLTDLQPAIRDADGAVIDMVGKATIGRTMSIIKHAALVVANDSAPLHMAVGFDRPIVALFGPTDPARVGPYQRDDAVVRRYAPKPGERITHKTRSIGDRLMRLIEVDDVLAVVDAQLQQPRIDAARPPDSIPTADPHGCTT
jgi:heptosyltransferase-1